MYRILAVTCTTALLCLAPGIYPAPADQVRVTIETRPDQPAQAKPDDQPNAQPKAKPDVKPDDQPGNDADAPFAGQRPSVDLAILLDTSNSMDGLIDQAKQQIWTIVNQFADAKKQGKTPLLRVALFQYGNNGLPASEGYIEQMVPLTDDLDELSAALFALTTNGGSEYCGQAIDTAVQALDWSGEPNSYKAIFIAGNEPFTQGPLAYQDACTGAIERGIVINTIHCGNYDTGVSGSWQHGAELAEGKYLSIDQDRAVVHIPAPQDKIIIELNQQLNATYIWYGQRAEQLRENQAAQDRNAALFSDSIAVKRAQAKASGIKGNYRNVGRDLVDTLEAEPEALKELDDDALPQEMQEMTDAQRRAHVEAMATKRAELQAKIKRLGEEREQYLAAERQKRAEQGGEATLGDAVTQAVQAQLKDAGFTVE